MQSEKNAKSEPAPTKRSRGNVPRIREVTAEVRTLIEDLRAREISETEIVIGIIAAVQAAPVTKALSQNPEVAAFLEKVGSFVRSGMDLLDLAKEKKP